MNRAILVALGSASVIVGVIGIFVPILPTTPFLLLAASLFARSCERCLRWLLTNPWFGRYLQNYRAGLGIPLRVKVATLIVLWCALGFSALYAVKSLWLQMALMIIGIGVTIHLLRLKTADTSVEEVPEQPSRNDVERKQTPQKEVLNG